MFKLPQLHGNIVPKEKEDIVFFSCDYDYFDRHGYALAQSINRTLGWMHVHCHVIDEGNMDKNVLDKMSAVYSFTYTYEQVNEDFYKSLAKNKKRMKEGQHIFKTNDLDYIARRTYLASVRFMRLAHLFKRDHQYILQVDCDTVLRNGFFQNDFKDLTKHVCVMPKPKDPSVFIASAICLGTGQNGVMFRELFSKRMIEAFEKEIYWYVDQDVLRNVMREWETAGRPWGKIPYKWNAWGQKRHDIFSTGKGDKKNDKRFKSAQLNWLPPHWKDKIFRELRDLPENIEL